MRDVESIMRIRHGLRLDEPNDFDLLTQDSILRLWDQISQATYLALVSISSIALIVGGIGVMAIMTISVKERTREVGTRRALGARRREILWQFLLEAVFLTAVGGVLGVLLGSGIGVAVHFATGFPLSLPWWSFAIGILRGHVCGSVVAYTSANIKVCIYSIGCSIRAITVFVDSIQRNVCCIRIDIGICVITVTVAVEAV